SRTRALLAAVSLAILPACQAVGPAFGSSPAEARQNGSDFFEAFAARYTNPERDARFDHARKRMSRYALAPSAIYDDTTVWNGGNESVRSLLVSGKPRQNRYRFTATSQPIVLTQPGDSRHVMNLSRVENGVYRWDTGVDMAVGPVAPDELLAVWRAMLLTAERGNEASLRADYRSAFPRTTRALGRMLTMDSLSVRRMADGSRFVRLVTTMHPDQVQRSGFPQFGRYLEKYFGPARYTMSLTDGEGARWMDATLYGRQFLFQFRVKDGRLLALDGTPTPFPKRSVLEMDVSGKIGMFGVAVRQLRGEVTLIESPAERGWLFRFRQEPKWEFPLAVDRIISSSLSRPFADDGITFRLTAIRGSGEAGQSIISRRLTAVLEESTIVRWLGNLGFTAMSDFQGEVEDEESRFLAEVFRAMSEDIRR